MRYVLRFCLQPGFHTDEKLQALLRYVQRAKIDEVMFFLNCEELYEGNISKEAFAPWMDTIAAAAKALASIGCGFSMNPWTTLGHADRGRTKPSGWDYQAMVAPDGQESSCTGCPSDEAFVSYLCDVYAHFASLSPAVLWLEDDFRLHNHAPLPWGGCFCPHHMQLYGERLGFSVSREEFATKAFAEGGPNPWRQAWLDVAQDTMRSLAQRIGDAVRAVNPSVALGLMSSVPAVHCAENRDWQGIFEGLKTGVTAHSRPHLPAYSDVAPVPYLMRFAGVTARTVDALPPGTPVYPELENFPHSRFSKSDAMGAFQFESALAVGIDGMTMNLFDMMGNGIDEADSFDQYLSRRKPYLSAVTALGLGKQQHRGIAALYDDQSSAHLQAQQGAGTPAALFPQEDIFGGLLPLMGISTLPRETGRPGRNNIAAVCGQYLRSLSDDAIRALFESHKLLIDGESALILMERGLGSLVGAASATLVPQDSGINAYEQACDGYCYAGFDQARVSCQGRAGDWVNIAYVEGARLISQVHDCHGNLSGPGLARYGNALILPYRFDGRFANHLTRTRQQMLQRVMAEWGVPMVTGDVCVALYAYDNALLLVNASMDDAHGLTIRWPEKAGVPLWEIGPDGTRTQAGTLSPDGEWAAGSVRSLASRTFTFAP